MQKSLLLLLLAILGAFMLAGAISCTSRPEAAPADERQALPMDDTEDQTNQIGETTQMEKATFGAGCFWGVEHTFRQLPGVKEAISGYAGGEMENPTYHDVCTGKTGHAEVVEVTYDPAEVTYDRLLEVFWKAHNPTTLNRQGPDVGTQYRSAIFYHSPEQQAAAQSSKERLQQSEKYAKRPIVTEISPASTFYPAEEYHQRYLEKRGIEQCHVDLE